MKKKGLNIVNADFLRSKAEETLAEDPGRGLKTEIEDVQRLIHELQVHQIELQMQNDELRRAQEVIAESQSKYADLYDFAPVGYFSLDRKGLVMEVNLTGAQLLGAERRVLIGKPFSLFVAPEARDVAHLHRTRLTKTGERQTSELLLKKKDGTTFHARMESIQVRDYKGEVLYRSVITDITEQKRLQAQSLLSAIVESSNDAIIGKAPDGIILSWNHAAEKLYGYSSQEAIGRPISMLVPPGREDEVPEILRRIRNGERVERFETVRVRKDGTHVEVSLSVSPLRDAQHTIIGASTIAHDMTGRKQAERALLEKYDEMELQMQERTSELTDVLAVLSAETTELHQAEVDLKQSEMRYRRIVETSGEGVWVIDAEEKTSFVNLKMAEMLGYTVEEMIGQPLYAFMDEEGRAETKANIKRQRMGIKEQRDYKLRRKDGSSVWTIVSASPIFDEHGTYAGSLGMITDITQRLELERQLRQSQKMEAIGTFAGGIAHDFNNILAAILGSTEMAMDDTPEGGLPRHNMERVRRAVLRGRDLVKQILAFSRQSEQERRPIQPHLIVQESMKLIGASLPASIEIRQNIQSRSFIQADPIQIQQVLMNLGTNAGHAMMGQPGILRIKLSDVLFSTPEELPRPDMEPGWYVKLSVADTGCGMDRKTLDRIFDPFFTTKPVGEGTGLGLSVVHGIVKAHKGAIIVESKPGKGTLFAIFFPRAETPAKVETEEDQPLPGGHESILFVDDEQELVEMGKELLQGLGYRVTGVTGSLKALGLFKEDPNRFDLVITDLTMPQMVGTTLADKLRLVRPDIPIILCTGHNEGIPLKRMKELGIRELVTKPMLRQETAEMVRRVLESKVES